MTRTIMTAAMIGLVVHILHFKTLPPRPQNTILKIYLDDFIMDFSADGNNCFCLIPALILKLV